MTEKQAIKELRRLNKPRQFAVKLYGKHRVYIEVAWEDYVKLSFNEVGFCTGQDDGCFFREGVYFDQTITKRSISLEKFQSELTKWEDDIGKCCDEIDVLARKSGFKSFSKRTAYFDKLFSLAADAEFEDKFGKGVCCVFH